MLMKQGIIGVSKCQQVNDSGEHPCGVGLRRKGVDSNSNLCVECLRWVHKRCNMASQESLRVMLLSFICRGSFNCRKISSNPFC